MPRRSELTPGNASVSQARSKSTKLRGESPPHPGKQSFMKTIAVILVAYLFEAGLLAEQTLTSNPNAIALEKVPAAELPAMTARLVMACKPQERNATTRNAVTAAVRINPAAAPLIVGAVSRAAPQTAAFAAQAAAREQPALAAAITRAAVGVAPAYAANIVRAVCSSVPGEQRNIAIAAVRAAPFASNEILRSVGSVQADLRPFIEREIEAHGRTAPSVAHCLDQATLAQSQAASAVPFARPYPRPPPVRPGPPGPPNPNKPPALRPPPDRPPPGGRNYARP